MEIDIPEEFIGRVCTLMDCIHPNEEPRLHFYGVISTLPEYPSSVAIAFPKGLKLSPNKHLSRLDYEKTRLIGLVEELPYWQEFHPDKPYIIVDFEAPVVDFTGEQIVALLPDVYTKEE